MPRCVVCGGGVSIIRLIIVVCVVVGVGGVSVVVYSRCCGVAALSPFWCLCCGRC